MSKCTLWPLRYVVVFFRMIQQAFIDMENMFELLDVDQEVSAADTATLRSTISIVN